MSVKHQPILGEITAFTITSPDLEESLTFYKMLGFHEVMRADWPFRWIQVSDGVVLIMLREGDNPYIALTYYTKEIEKVVKGLEKKGIEFAEKPAKGDMIKRYVLHSPDGLTVSLVGMIDGFSQPGGQSMLQMSPDDYFKTNLYPNKACGLYGEFAHPVIDIETSIAFWKLLGFEGVSEFAEPYSWAIMTDGLSVIGLHQTSHFSYPAITYFAADMPSKIAALKQKGLQDYMDQGMGNTIVETPEDQFIFLYQLGMGESNAPAPSDDLQQPIIETERLWLKELNPEIMNIVFTSYSDEEIVAFLGLKSENELDIEKINFSQGLSSYRSSFKAFLIVEKSSGQVIGKAGFHNWATQHSRAEVGYAIYDDADKGKGYMTEALAAIIDFGFMHMRLNRIEAFVGTNNEPSLKLLARFGFVREGVLRSHYFKNNRMEDSVCFSLLQSEYVATI
jgi:[ribosomal protein S5]-alanine N-acetyltransferase